MQLDEIQTGVARLNVTQGKHDFPSGKCYFRCGSSTHFANKFNIAKGKNLSKMWERGRFWGCFQIKTSEITC